MIRWLSGIKPGTVYNNIVSNEDELDPNLSRLRKSKGTQPQGLNPQLTL